MDGGWCIDNSYNLLHPGSASLYLNILFSSPGSLGMKKIFKYWNKYVSAGKNKNKI